MIFLVINFRRSLVSRIICKYLIDVVYTPLNKNLYLRIYKSSRCQIKLKTRKFTCITYQQLHMSKLPHDCTLVQRFAYPFQKHSFLKKHLLVFRVQTAIGFDVTILVVTRFIHVHHFRFFLRIVDHLLYRDIR